MTTVLIVEGDEAVRHNLTGLLELEGYEVVSAGNGEQGFERARQLRPDLVISGLDLPGMDGLALLAAIRSERELALTPVLLLTALADRASMRRGMAAGADDCLGKPFVPGEVLEALQTLQKKKQRIDQAVESAVRLSEGQLRRSFARNLEERTWPGRFMQAPAGATAETVIHATVLFSDIRNFTELAEKLSSSEAAELLTAYFDRLCEPVVRNGGQHLKFIGDGLMSVFVDSLSAGSPLPAARRAVSAALGVALAAHEFRAWLAQRFAGRGLPPFAVGVGLHAGEVTLCRLGAGGEQQTTPIGDTVNVAARLESASKDLGWTVVASNAVLQRGGEGIQTGSVTSLNVRGKSLYIDVAEITGLVPTPEDQRHGMPALARAEDLRLALHVNSEIAGRSSRNSWPSMLATVGRDPLGDRPPRLQAYRLARNLGSGGMTQVYLALREADGLPVVLKLLDASGQGASEHLSRFIQEYTLLSRIEHPHVIRIYDQGFADDHAYIAMEYFEHGNLRAEIEAGMSQQRVVAIVGQAARALSALHARGIVHRDLKPENIMRRADGSVALADFGIATSLVDVPAPVPQVRREAQAPGTPYYLSPEQAAGHPGTPQMDLFSLGVIMFEMLTGHRPFRAESLGSVPSRHAAAPPPVLPPAHAALQPVVDKLIARQPQERYASAQALLDDLEQRVSGPALQALSADPAAPAPEV